jgi:RNA polymerase sigma-B factor
MAAVIAERPVDDRQRMVERHLPLADNLARRYRHTSEPLDDLMQVARMGLVKAVDRWDPGRGTAFSSFAVPTITGELQRHFRDRGWTIRPPRNIQELYLRVQRAREALSQDLGREPTARDVGSYLDRSTEDVVEAMQVGGAYAPQSLDAPVSGEESDGFTLLDHVVDTRRDIDRTVTTTALGQLGDVLDDRAREIVRLRFDEDLIQREIADRVGCSQMHVSRILTEALARLRDAATVYDTAFD